MMVKTVNRNVKFNTSDRLESSSYKCNYGDKDLFEILRINISYASERRIYEIESKYLKATSKSIHFDAIKNGDSFDIEWTPQCIVPFMKRIE